MIIISPWDERALYRILIFSKLMLYASFIFIKEYGHASFHGLPCFLFWLFLLSLWPFVLRPKFLPRMIMWTKLINLLFLHFFFERTKKNGWFLVSFIEGRVRVMCVESAGKYRRKQDLTALLCTQSKTLQLQNSSVYKSFKYDMHPNHLVSKHSDNEKHPHRVRWGRYYLNCSIPHMHSWFRIFDSILWSHWCLRPFTLFHDGLIGSQFIGLYIYVILV